MAGSIGVFFGVSYSWIKVPDPRCASLKESESLFGARGEGRRIAFRVYLDLDRATTLAGSRYPGMRR